MFMILRSFLNDQSDLLIIGLCIHHLILQLWTPSIQYVSNSYISILLTYQTVSLEKGNDACLVTECKAAASGS
jgi:hypothetical protein